VDGMTNCNP